MMRLSDNVYIKCNKCNLITMVEMDELEYDTSINERAMGEEIEYDFRGEIRCGRCNTWIDFSIRGYEYPVGAFNFSDYDCNLGQFIKEPTLEIEYEIEYEFDDDYSDYAYEEYIEAELLLDSNRRKIKNMSPREFEIFVANIFEKLGFTTKVTKETRDGGYDIIATKADPIPYTLIIECKHWGEKHKVDVSVIRSIYGVQTAEKANQSIVVTSSKFTKDAKRFAEECNTLMTLLDIDDLLKLIEKDSI